MIKSVKCISDEVGEEVFCSMLVMFGQQPGEEQGVHVQGLGQGGLDVWLWPRDWRVYWGGTNGGASVSNLRPSLWSLELALQLHHSRSAGRAPAPVFEQSAYLTNWLQNIEFRKLMQNLSVFPSWWGFALLRAIIMLLYSTPWCCILLKPRNTLSEEEKVLQVAFYEGLTVFSVLP